MTTKQNRQTVASSLALLLAFGFSSLASAQESAKADVKLNSASKTELKPAAQDASPADPETQALYDKLAKYLTGTRWKGKFTVTGMDKEPTEEQYEITKAIKAKKATIGIWSHESNTEKTIRRFHCLH